MTTPGLKSHKRLRASRGLGGLLAQPPSTPVGTIADGGVALVPLRRWGLWSPKHGRWMMIGLCETPRIFFWEYEAKAAERDYKGEWDLEGDWKAAEMASNAD